MTVVVSFDRELVTLSRRDSQKGRVYEAEQQAAIACPKLAERIEDYTKLVAYVRGIVGTVTYRKLCMRAGFTPPTPDRFAVADGRGTRIARGWFGRVNLPTWARSKYVILHELAHSCSPRGVGHHWPFVRAYLDLVAMFVGREAADTLRRKFKEHKVRWTPKATRTMSPERLEALRSRMSSVRAARVKPVEQAPVPPTVPEVSMQELWIEFATQA